MTNEEFKYWITGYLALTTEDCINLKQLNIIKNHGNLVKSVEGVLDSNIDYFLSMIEENLKTKTPINVADIRIIWSGHTATKKA